MEGIKLAQTDVLSGCLQIEASACAADIAPGGVSDVSQSVEVGAVDVGVVGQRADYVVDSFVS